MESPHNWTVLVVGLNVYIEDDLFHSVMSHRDSFTSRGFTQIRKVSLWEGENSEPSASQLHRFRDELPQAFVIVRPLSGAPYTHGTDGVLTLNGS